MEVYQTGSGNNILVHDEDKCKGEHCPIHNPSEAAEAIGYTHWRGDRRIMERICAHGVGHPDPDATTDDDGIHGCDGCCSPPYGIPFGADRIVEETPLDALQRLFYRADILAGELEARDVKASLWKVVSFQRAMELAKECLEHEGRSTDRPST